MQTFHSPTKKIIIIILTSLSSLTLTAQKIVSYKYEKEERGKTIFGKRIVNARRSAFERTIPTTFIFDSTKNTIKIGSVTYKIVSNTNCDYFLTGNWTRLSIVNLYDKEHDVELIFQYDSTYYRYYFKRSSWKNPFGCTW